MAFPNSMTQSISKLSRGVAEGPVVSNTSPLIKLAGVGLLDLLPSLYGMIWIAPEVRAEYQAKALASDPDLDHLLWLVVTPVVVELELAAMQNLACFRHHNG